MALRRILAAPEFVFRFERAADDVEPGEIYRSSDLELASRLSFFLWSSIPDDELLDARRRRQAPRAGDAAQAGAAHARRRALERVHRELRRPMAVSAQSRDQRRRGRAVPELRRQPAPGLPHRDRDAVREHRARGSQRARSADGRLHVRQRAARAPLRHAGHLRQRVPPRARRERSAPRRAWAKAAFCSSRRCRNAPRPCSAACGFSRTSSARPCRRRRPIVPGSRGASRARRTIRARCASRCSCTRRGRFARAATRSWTRSASRWRTSTRSGAGAPRSTGNRSTRRRGSSTAPRSTARSTCATRC